MNRVPIRNIYYLLGYAWNMLEEQALVDVQAETCPDLFNLFSRVLSSGTSILLRRGLDKGYVRRRESTQKPRGAIDFDVTLRELSLARREMVCGFEHLSYDVLHNRILKSTIR